MNLPLRLARSRATGRLSARSQQAWNERARRMSGLVGIDVGGTFTDLYHAPGDGTPPRILKVPSTPDDPSRGLIEALDAAGIAPDGVAAILHGTTIATNAVIERRGAHMALVTTRGFRDVLELGRRDRPQMYGLSGNHRPLVPRDRRWEVTERLSHKGEVLVPLDDAEVAALAEVLKRQNVEAVAVSLLHAYANPAHEQRVRAILLEACPDWHVVTSTQVVREYYEFERTSTAVVQGYLQPLIGRYARRLGERLGEWGFGADILVMQSNGGLVPVAQLADRAASIVRSGPAAGVMAAARIASAAGFRHVITGDMGGTSFDVAVVLDGSPDVAETTNLDFRMPLRVPMIDVHTIGAGGGSIAHVNRGGMLEVGPRSAGSMPGPVAYGQGGTEPTVTDANIVLARINPDRPIGRGHGLQLELARDSMRRIGDRLGLGVEQTAEAVLAVINQRMAGRMRLLSIERGLDPRDFALVAFGGAGPLHGAALIREVGVQTMLVPPHPGVLCAMGCVIAELRHDLSQTLEKGLEAMDAGDVAAILAAQAAEGRERILTGGIAVDGIAVEHTADMAYRGQIHTVRVPIEPGWPADRIGAAFREVYGAKYGRPLDVPGRIVNLRTSVAGLRAPATGTAADIGEAWHPVEAARRPVHFGGWVETRVYDRAALGPGAAFDGPAIVEHVDTTTVIEPGMRARVDAWNNLLVECA